MVSPKSVVEPVVNPSATKDGQIIKTQYVSLPVDVPADFLAGPPPADAYPASYQEIDWASTPLPGNDKRFACVLDGVLSPRECRQLLDLAESSVPPPPAPAPSTTSSSSTSSSLLGKLAARITCSTNDAKCTTTTPTATDSASSPAPDPWRPALVNIGGGREVLTQDYRNGDRIIWDRQDIVDRLWERCVAVGGEALLSHVREVNGDEIVLGRYVGARNQWWVLRRLNERMRFLRYKKGGFFRREYPPCIVNHLSRGL